MSRSMLQANLGPDGPRMTYAHFWDAAVNASPVCSDSLIFDAMNRAYLPLLTRECGG